MTDRLRWRAAIAPIALLVLIAVALLPATGAGIRLANPDTGPADRLSAVVDGLGEEPLVLVGFDPDLGTYAEIRPTVRVLLADLLERGATLAFVSLTPEGRALANAEMDRLGQAGVQAARVLDLGFVPGSEAGIVAIARGMPPEGTDGLMVGLSDALDDGSSFGAALVVGGNDIGPRSWVEQLAPRVEDLPLIALAPSVLLPELQPYVASGQLAALIGTPRDGAAYRATVEPGPLAALRDPFEPGPLPILLGVLVAVGVLGVSLGLHGVAALRASGARDAS